MSDDTTAHDFADEFAGGEQEGLPPAPEGADDRPGEPAPDEVFIAPEGSDAFDAPDSVRDEREPSDEAASGA